MNELEQKLIDMQKICDDPNIDGDVKDRTFVETLRDMAEGDDFATICIRPIGSLDRPVICIMADDDSSPKTMMLFTSPETVQRYLERSTIKQRMEIFIKQMSMAEATRFFSSIPNHNDIIINNFSRDRSIVIDGSSLDYVFRICQEKRNRIALTLRTDLENYPEAQKACEELIQAAKKDDNILAMWMAVDVTEPENKKYLVVVDLRDKSDGMAVKASIEITGLASSIVNGDVKVAQYQDVMYDTYLNRARPFYRAAPRGEQK